MKLVLQFLKNSFIAIVRGELLLRLKLGEYFVHIMFCFMMMGLTILFSMLIDNSLHKVEENREKIDDLEMVGSQYRFEIAYLESRPSVSDQLARMGSSVREPAAPATIIKLENPAPAAGRRAGNINR